MIQRKARSIPAGMKKEYLDKIEAAIEKALQDPEFIPKAKEIKLPVDFMNSKDYTKFLKEISDDLKNQCEKSPW